MYLLFHVISKETLYLSTVRYTDDIETDYTSYCGQNILPRQLSDHILTATTYIFGHYELQKLSTTHRVILKCLPFFFLLQFNLEYIHE